MASNSLAHEQKILATRDREMIPTGLIIACVVLALSSLALVSYAQYTDAPNVGQPDVAAVTNERMLTLEGSRNGSVIVTDVATGRTASFASNESGFVSVITRGLERKRMIADVEGNPPVRIVEFENGRLALQDPASGWETELAFFGQTNRDAFAQFLR
ncbi:MAG: photosynthetic complex assembly protein PuhC [Pseudomonadota bacterium]